ncbi:hypothetical protein GCM10011515_01640 [Tsuneonella deserti]|uniref:Uncharacterized protein n=1 Tax=Tsuneonella deserti TaxID=2035528 RepID=A0ABQ1RWW1_9SPHN|nr:hypothetical protein GCM10011515_01640 [Tsuneonella deserti]
MMPIIDKALFAYRQSIILKIDKALEAGEIAAARLPPEDAGGCERFDLRVASPYMAVRPFASSTVRFMRGNRAQDGSGVSIIATHLQLPPGSVCLKLRVFRVPISRPRGI